MTIDVYAADEQEDLPVDLARWSGLCRAALEDEGVRGPAEVSLTFCDEATIAELNGQFMGKQGPTDVLSFPLDFDEGPSGRNPDSGGPGPGGPVESEIPSLVGDIIICPTVAARNSVEHGVSVDDELALLVVHGSLHLLGWDHVVDAEAEKMEAREREILARHYRGATQ